MIGIGSTDLHDGKVLLKFIYILFNLLRPTWSIRQLMILMLLMSIDVI